MTRRRTVAGDLAAMKRSFARWTAVRHPHLDVVDRHEYRRPDGTVVATAARTGSRLGTDGWAWRAGEASGTAGSLGAAKEAAEAALWKEAGL